MKYKVKMNNLIYLTILKSIIHFTHPLVHICTQTHTHTLSHTLSLTHTPSLSLSHTRTLLGRSAMTSLLILLNKKGFSTLWREETTNFFSSSFNSFSLFSPIDCELLLFLFFVFWNNLFFFFFFFFILPFSNFWCDVQEIYSDVEVVKIRTKVRMRIE